MIVCNDATVKGGTYYPMTVKKHLRAQEIALENRLPCVYLVDSGGANLPHQTEVFPDREHFGRIFFNQAKMSAAGIPQVASVMGSCTAGGAYVPAMSDETVIVKGEGTIFLGGPPLVKAATGEIVTRRGARRRRRPCPPLRRRRPLCARRPSCAGARPADRRKSRRRPPELSFLSAKSPSRLARRRSWRGSCRSIFAASTTARTIIARLVDGSDFSEFKALYGDTLVTGFAAIQGMRGRHPRQQRHPLLRVGAEGRAFHRALLPAEDPASLPAEHHRLHGRARTTRRAASPRTAPSSSPPSPAPPCRRSR